MGSAAQAIDVADILQDLPGRLHQTMDRAVAATPDHPALIEDSSTWSYRKLSESVQQVASALRDLGVRPGDRIMLVSENCIALAALLLAASSIDAWAIVANPRLS